jgi:hypothetical protein
MDEKDRFGQKLHDVEKAREDQWAREQDRKLLDQIRQRSPHELHCPQCSDKLASRVIGGLAVMGCPHGHGGWLDQESLRHLEKL